MYRKCVRFLAGVYNHLVVVLMVFGYDDSSSGGLSPFFPRPPHRRAGDYRGAGMRNIDVCTKLTSEPTQPQTTKINPFCLHGPPTPPTTPL